MYSRRNHSTEEPYNREGLLMHHLADGSNFLIRDGQEYFDIFPLWDWQKIPGTTAVQHDRLPPPEKVQQRGLTAFVGGASDGRYGAVGFDFVSPLDALAARKAWFSSPMSMCAWARVSSPTTRSPSSPPSTNATWRGRWSWVA